MWLQYNNKTQLFITISNRKLNKQGIALCTNGNLNNKCVHAHKVASNYYRFWLTSNIDKLLLFWNNYITV